MTDERKKHLEALKIRLEEIQIDLESTASDEYDDQNWFDKKDPEYDEIGYNGASLEDAASFIKDALQEITDAIGA